MTMTTSLNFVPQLWQVEFRCQAKKHAL